MSAPLFRSILAATDLSEASDAVLRAAGRLAAASGATLHVVHAFDLPATPYADATGLGTTMALESFPERVRDARVALQAQCIRALPDGVEPATREVVIYVAHRAIAERALAVDADLVVLGPHRRRGFGDALLGTTADLVIRTSPVPCLVARGELKLPLRRVVAPVDLSEPARNALDQAVAWSAALGAGSADALRPATELRVVHVVPRFLVAPDLPFDRALVGPELHGDVQGALDRAGGAAGVDVSEELLFGDSLAETITGFAEREAAGLVVMGTHGYGAIRRALIGSVASGVARSAPCPVLLVPPPRGAGEPREEAFAAGHAASSGRDR